MIICPVEIQKLLVRQLRDHIRITAGFIGVRSVREQRILGTLTVFFPLYMAVIIAFKKPSEMTNDVAGALSFPKQWSFENFHQAMEVTDFWHFHRINDQRQI